jgi:hypothetical protein
MSGYPAIRPCDYWEAESEDNFRLVDLNGLNHFDARNRE